MAASKTIGDWAYWLFLYGVACIPAALFGGLVASSFVYNYDWGHRQHLAHYSETLNFWEWAAAIAFAAPGFIWVGMSQLRGHLKEKGTMS